MMFGQSKGIATGKRSPVFEKINKYDVHPIYHKFRKRHVEILITQPFKVTSQINRQKGAPLGEDRTGNPRTAKS